MCNDAQAPCGIQEFENDSDFLCFEMAAGESRCLSESFTSWIDIVEPIVIAQTRIGGDHQLGTITWQMMIAMTWSSYCKMIMTKSCGKAWLLCFPFPKSSSNFCGTWDSNPSPNAVGFNLLGCPQKNQGCSDPIISKWEPQGGELMERWNLFLKNASLSTHKFPPCI